MYLKAILLLCAVGSFCGHGALGSPPRPLYNYAKEGEQYKWQRDVGDGVLLNESVTISRDWQLVYYQAVMNKPNVEEPKVFFQRSSVMYDLSRGPGKGVVGIRLDSERPARCYILTYTEKRSFDEMATVALMRKDGEPVTKHMKADGTFKPINIQDDELHDESEFGSLPFHMSRFCTLGRYPRRDYVKLGIYEGAENPEDAIPADVAKWDPNDRATRTQYEFFMLDTLMVLDDLLEQHSWKHHRAGEL